MHTHICTQLLHVWGTIQMHTDPLSPPLNVQFSRLPWPFLGGANVSEGRGNLRKQEEMVRGAGRTSFNDREGEKQEDWHLEAEGLRMEEAKKTRGNKRRRKDREGNGMRRGKWWGNKRGLTGRGGERTGRGRKWCRRNEERIEGEKKGWVEARTWMLV